MERKFKAGDLVKHRYHPDRMVVVKYMERVDAGVVPLAPDVEMVVCRWHHSTNHEMFAFPESQLEPFPE